MKVHIKDVIELQNQVFKNGEEVWFVTRLIEKSKDLPVQEMPVPALNTCNLHPKPENMAEFVSHIKHVLDADLQYPIILDDEGYVIDNKFEGATAGAMWDDAKLGLASFTKYRKMAVVTDINWLRNSTRVFGVLMPGEIRAYPLHQRSLADDWIRT